MASSKVIASRSPPNQSPPRQPPSTIINSVQSRNLGSMNIDDMFRSIYSDPNSLTATLGDGDDNRNRNGVDGAPAVTLEDFLTKAGAISEGDLRVPAPSVTVPTADFGTIATGFPVTVCGTAVGGEGRKRRRAVEEFAAEKVTQQKQRRMIKNRESAARSRERKQAYAVELESMATQLEEDNARLLKEEVELNKQRYKQLMENIIPVIERRSRARRVIKRLHSMEW